MTKTLFASAILAQTIATVVGRQLWRQESELDLAGVALIRANLVGADFQGANLRAALFRDANLVSASFQGAKLVRADLQGATLVGADFRGAFLFGANLANADLEDADFRGAYLDLANLATARNLTQEQIENARGDASTQLPLGLGLERPAHWIPEGASRDTEALIKSV